MVQVNPGRESCVDCRRILMIGRVVLVGILAAWLCGGLAIYSLPPPRGPTLSNFNRIRMGMTRRQVEQILGAPREPPCFGGGTKARSGWTCQNWYAGIVITYKLRNGNITVVDKEWNEERKNLCDNALVWLKLQPRAVVRE